MSNHDHHHHHSHGAENITTAFIINIIFTIIEIIGGFYTNSVAILSDALHDLGDSMSLGIAWYFQKVSAKSKDKKFSYGYSRFSLLGAIINSVILLTGSVIILVTAVPRLINPENPDSKGMIILAVLGVIFNGAGFIKLRKGKTINEEAISLHLLEDVLGWAAVLIGAIIMYFFDLPILDPLLSILIALFIVYNVVKNLKKSVTIILQGVPDSRLMDKIQQEIRNIEGIINIHDCHLWTMDGEYFVFSAHVVVEEPNDLKNLIPLKRELYEILSKHNINHPTIEFETVDEECLIKDC